VSKRFGKKTWRLEVTWRDSMLDNGGWEKIKDHAAQRWGDSIHSVGFILCDDKEGISLASSVHGWKAAGVVHIPAGMILKRRRIRP
jgi:hypothetical protein